MKYIFLCGFILCACVNTPPKTLFSNVTKESGVDFSNTLTFTDELNPYTFRNFFNGGGVALGDINNDGLIDIYFTGNQVNSRLYLNKGHFEFEDITEKAGVACQHVWSTGVTLVDINADGYLDIYVCKSGPPAGENRHNELFINNGDLTFTEQAKAYGLDITGLAVQAAFFDYDRDGDLDCYLLTNSIKSIGNFDLIKDQRTIAAPNGEGNRFLMNRDGKFHDYTVQAGIYASAIGFGLGITLGDFNEDDWVDVFVSNDFFERDYLYLNNQDGSFKEALPDFFQSISMGSMGADFADLDNDGLSELFVTEMLPDSLSRRKTKTLFESWDRYQLSVQNGYHHQFSRNVLQKKSSSGNYHEIGRMAGVAATEWSWGALLFDMDNDGWKDIFVANGIYKDLLDRDYLAYTGSPENVRNIIKSEKDPIIKLINQMPASDFTNYTFQNKGKLEFNNVTRVWGFDQTMYSCGSAYGDLDNDGDQDLVINNINSVAALYRNNTDTAESKSLNISLIGNRENTKALGATVRAYIGSQQFAIDNYVSRGFQSSVDSRICLGVGSNKTVDSVTVQWPTGEITKLEGVQSNRLLEVSQGTDVRKVQKANRLPRVPMLSLVDSSIFIHKSASLVDFNRERLLPMMHSNESPRLIKGDIDGDGQDEIYVGGSRKKAGIVIRIVSGKIQSQSLQGEFVYSLGEETGSTLFDADQDGDLDLYLSAGGRFYSAGSNALLNKLVLNDGKGMFNASEDIVGVGSISTSVVKSIDFDQDGDLDLIVGERFNPNSYGTGGRAYLLENSGKGVFQDVTRSMAPQLEQVGMVTDIAVCDYDRDGWMDIVMTGDWAPIRIFKNERKKFRDVSASLGLGATAGWWHVMEVADLNEDGKPDFVVGNQGLNSFFKKKDRMYVADFDDNGSIDPIYCTKSGKEYFPIHDKDDFLAQFPSLKKSLLYYKDYSEKPIDKLFPKMPANVKMFEVETLVSSIFLSVADGYQELPLPNEAQYSSIYALAILDMDMDGVKDILAGGNQYGVKPQFGRSDASSGWFFKGVLTKGQYSVSPGYDLNVKGQIRDIDYLESKGGRYLFFAKYNEALEIYRLAN